MCSSDHANLCQCPTCVVDATSCSSHSITKPVSKILFDVNPVLRRSLEPLTSLEVMASHLCIFQAMHQLCMGDLAMTTEEDRIFETNVTTYDLIKLALEALQLGLQFSLLLGRFCVHQCPQTRPGRDACGLFQLEPDGDRPQLHRQEGQLPFGLPATKISGLHFTLPFLAWLAKRLERQQGLPFQNLSLMILAWSAASTEGAHHTCQFVSKANWIGCSSSQQTYEASANMITSGARTSNAPGPVAGISAHWTSSDVSSRNASFTLGGFELATGPSLASALRCVARASFFSAIWVLASA